MVNGWKGEVLKTKVDPFAKCDERVVAKSVLFTKCGKWVNSRCTKI